MQSVHYVDFSSDGRRAVCGWEPPPDYAGCTIFISGPTCQTCMDQIQQRLGRIQIDAGCEASCSIG